MRNSGCHHTHLRRLHLAAFAEQLTRCCTMPGTRARTWAMRDASVRPGSSRHISVRDHCLADMKQTLARSARLRASPLPVPAEAAARGLHALIDGMIQNWLLDTDAFDLRACGRQAIDAYLSGLGLGGKPVPS
jgi:hypothetical protein